MKRFDSYVPGLIIMCVACGIMLQGCSRVDQQEKQRVQTFLTKVIAINNSYLSVFEEHQQFIAEVGFKKEKDAVESHISDMIEEISELKGELESVETPPACQHYKDLQLKAYDYLAEMSRMSLELIGTEEKSLEEYSRLRVITLKMKSATKKADDEFTKILDKYRIDEDLL